MKTPKKIILIISVILLLLTIIFEFMGAWMPVFSVLTGGLFLYYVPLFLLSVFAKNISDKALYILIFVPLILFLLFLPMIIDSVMSSALKGYKYQI